MTSYRTAMMTAEDLRMADEARRIKDLVARVRRLISEPSRPEEWRREHEAILAEHKPAMLLEAIKILLDEGAIEMLEMA